MVKTFWIGGKQNILSNLKANIFDRILIDKKRKDNHLLHNFKNAKFVDRREIEKIFFNYPNYNHQGFAALVSYNGLLTLNEFFLRKRDFNILALDNLEDIGNIGTIIRSCLAFGVNTVLLEKNKLTQNLTLIFKNTAGTFSKINLIYTSNIFNELRKFKTNNYNIVSLDKKSKINLAKFNWEEKNLIILGSEKKGIRKNILKKSDHIVKIETCDGVESLNAAQACSVCLYALKTQN